jgi:O-succinylhomoserine sulfhydrylase
MEKLMRTAGLSTSPFNAWVFSKGLETLGVRVRQASENALTIASAFEASGQFLSVNYPWLDSHPQQALAKRQQKSGGAVVSFEVKGGQSAAYELINATQLCSITANLGDTRTTITHPFTTTHARWSEELKAEVGISPSLIRLAVGLEDPQDILRDLGLG